MLFHFSMAAERPQHVADVLAEMLDGAVLPFPPAPGSSILMIGDDRGTAIEVYPLGTLIRETEGDADAGFTVDGVDRFTAFHAAIGTQRSTEEVLAIAAREGWSAKYRCRGGMFGVIELWVEGRQMLEVLTPAMQHEYRMGMTQANWQRMLDAGPPAAAAAA